jgi:integrase
MHEFAAQRGKKNPTTERRVFSPEDVQKLHAEALSQDRQTLADLIALGAYTGARIEELCRLKKSDVISEEGIQCFSIYDSKTEASTRLIPVHESLKNIVDRLIAESDDDYLIKSPAGNKYGNRSDALSKQFGRLKTGLSYNGQYVFHSLRKTVITQLQRADVPGILIASIVGHETGTVTFDVYSAGPSPKQKFSAISNLSYALK